MTEAERNRVNSLFKQKATAYENYSDKLEEAKKSASAIMQSVNPSQSLDLFFETDLTKIEDGIRNLNEYSNKCWLISAITLYSMIYDKGIYKQSGLTWEDYLRESRKRLGMDAREISESLSSARFFIKNHEALLRKGWSPVGSNIKLARAELALELSGSLEDTLTHLVNDSFRDFKDWYQSFKELKIVSPTSQIIDNTYTVEQGKYMYKGVSAVSVSSELPQEEQIKLNGYLQKIFDALKAGYEPAIIPVYDNKEATTLVRLRDKNRKSK